MNYDRVMGTQSNLTQAKLRIMSNIKINQLFVKLFIKDYSLNYLQRINLITIGSFLTILLPLESNTGEIDYFLPGWTK